MSADQTVDLSFRGIKLARGARLDDRGDGAFVTYETPLPVGSRIVVEVAGAAPREARVVGVVEQEAGGKTEPGMKLSWISESSAAPPGPQAEESAPSPAELDVTLRNQAPPEAADAGDADDAEAGEAEGPGTDGATAAAGKRGKKRRRR